MRNALRVCVVLAVLVPLSGCQSAPHADTTPAKVVKLTLASSAGPQQAIEIAPGLLQLEVEMTRSNRETCATSLTLAAAPAADLAVFAYELDRGIASATMRVEPAPDSRPSSSIWSGAFSYCGECFALFVLTAPIWYPIYALSKHNAEKSRQAASRWCYVWVEDARSGDWVAGRQPWQ